MRCVKYLLTFIFLIQIITTTNVLSNTTASGDTNANENGDNDYFAEIEARLNNIGGKLIKYDEEIFNPERHDYKSQELLNEIMNDITFFA